MPEVVTALLFIGESRQLFVTVDGAVPRRLFPFVGSKNKLSRTVFPEDAPLIPMLGPLRQRMLSSMIMFLAPGEPKASIPASAQSQMRLSRMMPPLPALSVYMH